MCPCIRATGVFTLPALVAGLAAAVSRLPIAASVKERALRGACGESGGTLRGTAFPLLLGTRMAKRASARARHGRIGP